MSRKMRCMFCGHRNEYEIPVGATERTRIQIVRLYRSGVSEFWSGGMGWFDRACEQTVCKLRSSGEIGLDAQLWLIRPYPPEESGEKAQSLNDAYTGVYCRRLRADACLRAKPENNPNHSRRSISPLLNFLFERMKGGRVKKRRQRDVQPVAYDF